MALISGAVGMTEHKNYNSSTNIYQPPRSLRMRLREAAPLVITLGLLAKALEAQSKYLTHRGSPDADNMLGPLEE